jgi:hypothetical protein
MDGSIAHSGDWHVRLRSAKSFGTGRRSTGAGEGWAGNNTCVSHMAVGAPASLETLSGPFAHLGRIPLPLPYEEWGVDVVEVDE